ncbi:MAG TPA: CoA transferase [Aliiroseovarius sp.]|nr:CoA transferase [Aliiroseovarius sp.]
MSDGPLQGLRVIEMAGLGPTPFAAMWLADMGADVVRIERPGLKPLIPMRQDVLNRGRGHVVLNMKDPDDLSRAKALIQRADLLIEGMRPGVMERLGLGPDVVLQKNPALVYGRMTGWGQSGPLAHSAGHDINYIALTGALHAMGDDAPAIPLNLVGDFGGGAMYLVAGLLAALLSAKTSGKGQVVDCAISDGAAHLMAMIYGMYGSGVWADQRASNLLDGAAPFYTTYECSCGGHMAVGALEPQFYTELLRLLALDNESLADRNDPQNWPELRAVFAKRFKQKTRAQWATIFEGTDACVMPVLSMEEAPDHAHNQARKAFVNIDEMAQPAAAPQLSATPGKARAALGEMHVADVLTRWTPKA